MFNSFRAIVQPHIESIQAAIQAPFANVEANGKVNEKANARR